MCIFGDAAHDARAAAARSKKNNRTAKNVFDFTH
jgi:hypothetical protein